MLKDSFFPEIKEIIEGYILPVPEQKALTKIKKLFSKKEKWKLDIVEYDKPLPTYTGFKYERRLEKKFNKSIESLTYSGKALHLKINTTEYLLRLYVKTNRL